MDDRIIIKRVKQGDIECFKELVERYHVPLLRFIHNLIRDPMLTEDVGQQVFLALYQNLDRYDENHEAPVSAWLFITARNMAINMLKKHLRLIPFGDMPLSVSADAGPDPADLLQDRFDRYVLEQCLDTLNEPYRSTLINSLQGSSIREIAVKQAVLPGTVKSRLHRARKQCALLYRSILQEVKNE